MVARLKYSEYGFSDPGDNTEVQQQIKEDLASIVNERSSMLFTTGCEAAMPGGYFPMTCLPGNGVPFLSRLRLDGICEASTKAMREQVRRHLGQDAQPSAGIINRHTVNILGVEKQAGQDAAILHLHPSKG